MMRHALITLTIAAVATVPPSFAESVYVSDVYPGDYHLLRFDVDAAVVTFDDSDSAWALVDLATDEGGDLFGSNQGRIIHTPIEGDDAQLYGLAPPWAFLSESYDVAVRSDGTVASLNRGHGSDGFSEVVLFSADASPLWRESISNHEIMGIDVAHAGPLENGIIALTVDVVGSWWFFHWMPRPDGSWERSGPVGPLAGLLAPPCAPYYACALHPTFARDGQSVFVVEPTTNTLRRYTVDGSGPTLELTFPQDVAALTSGVPGSRLDLLFNVSPLADGGAMVLTQRRLYRVDSVGSIVYRFDRIFGNAAAVAPAEWIPFESAGVRCRPFSTGFWKRQCASLGMRPRRLGTRGPRGTTLHPPPLHPAMTSIVDLATTVERANGWLEPYGLTACAALQPDAPSTWREKALRRYAAVALNFENRTLGRRCPITIDGVERAAGDVLDEIRTLLASTNEDELKRAFRLTGMLIKEEG